MTTTSARRRPFHRQVGWGEALHLEIHFHSPGLKPLVHAIHEAVGESVGARTTFDKLQRLDDVPTHPKDRWRAWLLLTALGQDPADWHIDNDIVPPSHDVERLRDLVRSWSPWITTECDDQLDLFAAA